MYETMEVYPLSWIFLFNLYLLVCFLRFLNMVIGIVVNVMEQENAKAKKEQDIANHEPTMKELMNEITALRQDIEKLKK